MYPRPTAHQRAQDAGFEGLQHLSSLCGACMNTLNNWFTHDRPRFERVLSEHLIPVSFL